jgi:GntR family transcriptional regulator/MocR family aminotransferase
MAVWVRLKNNISWHDVAKICDENGLTIPDYVNYDPNGLGHNGLRLGFASLNAEEQTAAILILKKSLMKISRK